MKTLKFLLCSSLVVLISSFSHGLYAQNIYTYAGNGVGGYNRDGIPATSAKINNPAGVVLDASGNLYITDFSNNRVREVNANTGIISTVAGNGIMGYSGDGGQATSAELNGPDGIALDTSGNIYFTDFNDCRVCKVTVSSGIITTIAGVGLASYSGDGGAATAAEFYGPAAIALDASGNIYVADEGNNRIRKITVSTGIITTVAGNGYGSPNSGAFYGDGGPATAAEFYSPAGVILDASGNIYISDGSNNRIREVNASTGIINTIVGAGGYGGPTTGGFSGDGGPASAAELFGTDALAFDASGNIYISDQNNNRIREVTISTGIINTLVGDGFGGYSGDGIPATSAALYYPRNLTLDALGNVYIADINNNRVRIVISDDTTSGIKELKETENISIFPNPFTSTTTIFLNPPSSLPNNHYLELDDITGRKLRYIEFTGTQYELSADGLAKGLYFIRIWDGENNVIGIRKVVVQ